MWIKREIEEKWSKLADEYPIIVVTGTRQVGKTSLLERIYGDESLISLDLPKNAEFAESSPEQFLAKLNLPTIIDEVQYAPTLFRGLKYFVDQKLKHKNGQIFLTGSEKFSLMAGVSESLAGRAGIVELHSLSHRELEKWSGKISEGVQLLEWIVFGGYPKLHARGLESERFYSNLIATYIERDIKRLSHIQNIREFDRFLRLAASRTGQLLSMSGIASEVGVSQTTIKHWINLLVASNVVALVEPWYNNLSKRLVKTPKLFFLDTGLCCHLMGITSVAELERSSFLGAIFETHTFGQMVRSFCNRGVLPRINFYRTHDGKEIDFIIQHGDEFELFECKWSENPKVDTSLISHFEEMSKGKVRHFSYVCSGRENRPTKFSTITIRNSIEF